MKKVNNKKIKSERNRYKKALKAISKMGRVCSLFEICSHESCADSCGAVLIALEALNLSRKV